MAKSSKSATLGSIGGLTLLGVSTFSGMLPANAEDTTAANEAVAAVAESGLATAAAASSNLLSADMIADFTYTGTHYQWDSQGNSLSITSAYLNQADGGNPVSNNTKGVISPPAGVKFNFTGKINLTNSDGTVTYGYFEKSGNDIQYVLNNVEGFYNVKFSVKIPTAYRGSTDTTPHDSTDSRPGTVILDGKTIETGETLTFKKPSAYIGPSAYIYDGGWNTDTGKYRGAGVVAFSPQPQDGSITLSFTAPEGTHFDCGENNKNLAYRSNNPSIDQLKEKRQSETGFTVDSVTCENGFWTATLSGIKKGDQGYVEFPIIFDELKAKYTDIKGSLTNTAGLYTEYTREFEPSEYNSKSDAANAKSTTKVYVNDANPEEPTGKTADGQDSDADKTPVYVMNGTPITVTVVSSNTSPSIDFAAAQLLNGNGEVIETTAIAHGDQIIRTYIIEPTNEVQTIKFSTVGLNGKDAVSSDIALVQGFDVVTAEANIVTKVNGEDANDKANPAVFAPGKITYTGTGTNTNDFVLTPENTTVTFNNNKVTLPADWKVEPGATFTLPEWNATLKAQGSSNGAFKISIKQPYELPEVLGGTKYATATATDPAYAKALTGSITTAPDATRVRVGETATIDALANDTANPEGTTLVAEATKAFADENWTTNEDGTFTSKDGSLTVKFESGKFEIVSATEEGSFTGLSYVATNSLGDVSEATPVTIEVYDYHVALEALVGEDKADADTSEDAFTITVAHDATGAKDVPVTLDYTNPGTEDITVTGFKDSNGNEYVLDTPQVVKAGEKFSFSGAMDFSVGESTVTFEVITEEGVTASDPIVVKVVQEEAPAPAPEPSETPAPVVKQEKPSAITPDTGMPGVTIKAAEDADVLVANKAHNSAVQGGLLGWLIAGFSALGGLATWVARRKKNS